MGRHPFKRRAPTRSIGRKVIIVCEGKRTETGYFNAIRVSMRIPTLQVQVLHSGGTDPLTIVRAALEQKETKRRDKAWTKGDSAWAVFDGDEHRDENPANWNDAIQLAASRDINLAISNPCFELWYLLHYHNQLAQLTRVEAQRVLRQYLPTYQKAHVLWPEPLKVLTADAIARARRLEERRTADDLAVHCNPSTGVSELIEFLLALEQERGESSS